MPSKWYSVERRIVATMRLNARRQSQEVSRFFTVTYDIYGTYCNVYRYIQLGMYIYLFRLYWHTLKTLNCITKLIMFNMSTIKDEKVLYQN